MADNVNKTEKPSGLSLKASLFLLIACPLIVITLSTIAIVITAGKLVPDDMYSFDEPVEYVYDVPETDADAVAMLTELIGKTEACDTVRIGTDDRVSFLKDSGTWDDKQLGFVSDAERAVLDGISNDVLKNDDYDCDYGEKAPVFFDTALLADAALKEAELNEDNGVLKVSLDLTAENGKTLFGGVTEQIGAAFTEAYKDVFSCDETTVGNAGVTVTAEIDAVKGELKKLTSVNGPVIKCDKVKFINDFAELGEKDLFIETELKRETNITFAGIDITKDILYIDPGSYDTVPANANIADGAEDAFLTYTSSDESICTVDENGMVEAVSESAEPATVTVTLSYLGKEFTDSCLVYIINETDGVNISEAKLTVKKGDTATLSAEVTPKKATVKDVMWLSSDESVATVDENGTVTALSAGEALITVVTVQGHFMEACHVTVTE